MIIKTNNANKTAEELNKNKISKEFLEECKKASELFSNTKNYSKDVEYYTTIISALELNLHNASSKEEFNKLTKVLNIVNNEFNDFIKR